MLRPMTQQEQENFDAVEDRIQRWEYATLKVLEVGSYTDLDGQMVMDARVRLFPFDPDEPAVWVFIRQIDFESAFRSLREGAPIMVEAGLEQGIVYPRPGDLTAVR